MVDWLKAHDSLLGWMTALSALTFLISMVVLPVLAARIPADYFTRGERPPSRFARLHPVWRVLLMTAKNGFGAALMLAGVVMLILPGNGILAIAIALLMMDLPGKYKIERWMITRSPVKKSINWVRKKTGKRPLDIPDDLMGRAMPPRALSRPIKTRASSP